MKTRTRYRSHTCGELRATDAGKTVTLCGFFVKGKTEDGFDLRDRHGFTRVSMGPRTPVDVRERVRKLSPEDVVMLIGDVVMRAEADPSLPTGDVYVMPKVVTPVSRADPLPPDVGPASDGDADLTHRLKYRYLDLRRPVMQKRLQYRARFMLEIRNYLAQSEFVEIETPYLSKWTEEAAAAFFVPARAGTSFALPQSPQLYKQLLMASGCDRYFQISKCFRNERHLGPDRQLEFTALDLEAAFIDEEDVYPLVDGLLAHLWNKFVGRRLETPVRRMTYAEAMQKYGTDRPDLRFGLELEDLTTAAARWPVPAIRDAMRPEDSAADVKGIGSLRGLRVPGPGNMLDAVLPTLGADLKPYGPSATTFWFRVDQGPQIRGPIAKHFDQQLARDLCAACGGARAGDAIVLIAAPNRATAAAVAAEARLRIGRALNLVDRDRHELLWVNEFPFWEYDPVAQGWTGCRHPFTQPLEQDLGKLERDKYSVRTKAYDLVLNGVELGAGSIRNHDPLIQQRIFEMFEYKPEVVWKRFGFVLEAFKFGIPPHGGLSIGLDRLLMQLLGVEGMEDVMAFPKDRDGSDPMVDAPTPIDPGFVRQMLT